MLLCGSRQTKAPRHKDKSARGHGIDAGQAVSIGGCSSSVGVVSTGTRARDLLAESVTNNFIIQRFSFDEIGSVPKGVRLIQGTLGYRS